MTPICRILNNFWKFPFLPLLGALLFSKRALKAKDIMRKINDEMELFTLEPEFEIGHIIFIGRNMFWRHYIAAGMQTYSTTQRSRMHVTAALKVFPVYCWTLGFTALGISSCCETSVWTFIVSFTAIVFNWWSSSSLISPWFDTHVAFVKNVFTRL